MGSQLPPGPSQGLSQGVSRGPRPEHSQEQAARGRGQRKASTFQNWLPSSRVEMPRLTYGFKVKHFLKTSIVRIEDRLLKRLFGPSRVFVTKFEKEFQVLLHVGKQDPSGKVEILIKGKGWYRKRAHRLLSVLASKSEGHSKLLRDTLILSLTNKPKKTSSRSTASRSDPAMTGLDVAMQSLELSHDTTQDTVNQDETM